MTTAYIHSLESLSRVVGELREAVKAHGYLRVAWKHDKDRSSLQNAHSHTWYEQVANELREDTALDVKCYCKLHFGVPILRAEDEDYRSTYDAVIKPLPYERKIEAMKCWPCTSLMTTAQLSVYLEAVKDHYDGRVQLEFPDEARFAA